MSSPPAKSDSTKSLGGQVLYFAYGANMRKSAFQDLCPGADWLGIARLPEHKVVIARHGYASVEPAPGEVVWGALWLVPAATLPALDEFEAVESGMYIRTTAKIITPAGPQVEVMLYLTPNPGRAPVQPGYLDHLLAGARENELSLAYLRRLEGLRTA